MPRVFFLNRFYWPNETATAQLLTDLAEELARRGWDITVITSGDVATDRQDRNGVRIERVCAANVSRRGAWARVTEYLRFHLAASVAAFRQAARGDAIVAMTDPPLLGVAVWPIARLRGARLVHWAQDIYPEIAVSVTGRRLFLSLCPLRNGSWRAAEACVAPGRDMAATIAGGSGPRVPVKVIPNWSPAGLKPADDREIAAQRARWGLTGRWVAAYSGNLGRVHDIDPLLDIAEALRDDPAFTLLVIGQGARHAPLEAAARARRLTNMRFVPPQPRENLPVSLGVADVHFVTLIPGAERSVFPSKLYGIAAVGRPVLFIGSPGSELARTVVEAGLGYAFARQDVTGVVAAIQSLRARPESWQRYCTAALQFAGNGFAQAANDWADVLAEATTGR